MWDLCLEERHLGPPSASGGCSTADRQSGTEKLKVRRDAQGHHDALSLIASWELLYVYVGILVRQSGRQRWLTRV